MYLYPAIDLYEGKTEDIPDSQLDDELEDIIEEPTLF